jgi:hypothetical protein
VLVEDTRVVTTTTSTGVSRDTEELRLLRLRSRGLPLDAVARRMYWAAGSVRTEADFAVYPVSSGEWAFESRTGR